MKLEIKHLAPYLAHKLRCQAMGESVNGTEYDDDPTPEIFHLVGLSETYVELCKNGNTFTEQYSFCDCIPLLRPLSDLTKEIEHSGQKFVPMEYLFEFENPYNKIPKRMKYYYEEVPNRISISHNASSRATEVLFSEMGANPYWMIQKLFEWHFDVFGLIDQGLALPLTFV